MERKQIIGKHRETTSNRMEMMAAILALEDIKPSACPITVLSDSQYLVKGMTEWLEDWKRNGWLNSEKKPVANRDLWERLDDLAQRHGDVRWEWQKGHNDNPMNEEVDMLASMAAKEAAIELAMQCGRRNP